MTKKDYDIIAACIGGALAASDRGGSPRNDENTILDVKVRLLNELGLQNPRFSETIFNARVEYWRKNHGGN